eukprot:106025_1
MSVDYCTFFLNDKCTRKNCKKPHIPKHKIPCRFGNNCTKYKNCPYMHEDEKQQAHEGVPNAKIEITQAMYSCVDELEKYHNKWTKNRQNYAVDNLGIYLKNVIVGYEQIQANNGGYMKYGGYARTFCECICQYILKEQSIHPQHKYGKFYTLTDFIPKLQRLKYKKSFPQTAMKEIDTLTFPIIHGVQYGQSARGRYLDVVKQQRIIVLLWQITKWLTTCYPNQLEL